MRKILTSYISFFYFKELNKVIKQKVLENKLKNNKYN